MITKSLSVDKAEFERRTGWTLRPEGACKGPVCIPLARQQTGDKVQLDQLAEDMGLPLVHDAEHGLWALGPEFVGSRALASAEAPNLRLPDLDGNVFELESLRGQKVLLLAWSPY
jgi:hypothetical protein